MADFNDVIIESWNKLNSVISNARQTNRKIAELKTQLSNIEQQIEVDWTEIEGKAQQLLQQIAVSQKSMATDARTIVRTLIQFRNNIESLESQFATSQQKTQIELAGLGETINSQQSELETAVETTAQSLTALQETFNSLTEEVEETNSEFQELLEEDVSNAIQELKSDLEVGGERAIEGMGETVISSLSAMRTEFVAGWDETIESVGSAVRELTQESKAASAELITEISNICAEYQASFDDEQEAFAEFTEKLIDVFTQEGMTKIDEVLQSSWLEAMKDNREQAEKIVELLTQVSDRLEEVR